MSKKRLMEMFLLLTQNLFLQAIINIKKIDHVKVIFSESSVSQIYFELTSIKKKIEVRIFKVLLYMCIFNQYMIPDQMVLSEGS